MGFLERAIRRGVSDAVGKAIGGAVQKAVEPTATDLANKAANAIDQAAGNAEQTVRQTSGLEGALGNLQRSMEGYATEAAKNIKICPKCGEGATADKNFCPGCGAKLPEKTVAEGAVCPSCGKQNTVGTKFCCDCGTKLPAAVQEEQRKAEGDTAVMREWDEKLPGFPKWNLGGCEFNIEPIDGGYMMFAVRFPGDPNAAYVAMTEYRKVLLQNGFRQAGQYPSIDHLYKKENGVCYHVDTEHCFGGDPDCATFGFDNYEPTGGFDYVKPEPKKKTSIFDLFKVTSKNPLNSCKTTPNMI